MSCIIAEQIKAGVILGDLVNREYVYMPDGEVGMDEPMCRLERVGEVRDLTFEEAIELVKKLDLRPLKRKSR